MTRMTTIPAAAAGILPASRIEKEAGLGEAALYAFTIAMATGPVDQLIEQGLMTETQRAIVWGGIYAAFMLLMLARPRLVGRTIASAWPLFAVPVLGILSISWSAAPQATTVGSIEVAVTVLFGAIIGLRMNEGRLLTMAVLTLGFLGVLDLAFMATPYYYDLNGNAAGIFVNKNINGQMMGTLVVAALAVLSWRGGRLWAWLALGLAIPQFVLSGSRTTWGMTLAAALVILLLHLRHMRAGERLTVTVGALGLAVLAGLAWVMHPVDLEAILLKAADKDITLTGRTVLWDLAAHYIRQSPLLGTGFSGFWTQDITGDAGFVNRVMGFDLPHFHNTFLEVTVELGWVGLVLAVASTLAFLLPLRWLLRYGEPAAAAFACALFAALVVASVSEVVIFVRHGVHLLLMGALWSRAYLLHRNASARPV